MPFGVLSYSGTQFMAVLAGAFFDNLSTCHFPANLIHTVSDSCCIGDGRLPTLAANYVNCGLPYTT